VIDINNNDLPVRPPVKLSEWEKAKGASKYRPLLRKAAKIFDEYIGTPIFVDERMYEDLENCDELRASLILGDEADAEAKARAIQEFIDYWKKESEGKKALLDLLEKLGSDRG
jgi:hypothetical protein